MRKRLFRRTALNGYKSYVDLDDGDIDESEDEEIDNEYDEIF